MAWRKETPPPSVPIIPAGEKCDAACEWPGQVRVRKVCSELCERNGEPHLFAVLRDLLFCTSHFRTHEGALRLDGWTQVPPGGAL